MDIGRYIPLHLAAMYGHTRMVELLLMKGAGFIWLRRGDTSIVKLLLEKDALIEARNFRGYIPIDLVILWGHPDTTQLLKNKAAELAVHGNRK